MLILAFPSPRKTEGLWIWVWFRAIFSYRLQALNRRLSQRKQKLSFLKQNKHD